MQHRFLFCARFYARSSALALLASPGSVVVDQALDHACGVVKNRNLRLILHVSMNGGDDGQSCADTAFTKQNASVAPL